MSAADRFRPVRAGIVNLYEYADQVFELEGGRLLLRGHNTSGKTKALELLLPFALDGDVSPRKLDPFAHNAKEMRWNLLGCTDDRHRRGYVWLEFERLDGEPARVTAGIGLSAHRDETGVKRWYFVARERRVGHDLHLVRDGEPIPKGQLAEALGADGELLDSQAAYRGRLNELVFGFSSMDLYGTMLRLALELRRPHLSKSLNPDGVAQLLSSALPEVDLDLMRRLGEGLEQLDALERRLERLRGVRERLRGFHERTYRAYLRALVRERATAVRQAQSGVERSAAALRDAREALEQRGVERERAAAAYAEAAELCLGLEGEERAIVTSAAWASVAEVDQLGERARAVERAAEREERQAEREAERTVGLEAELVTAEAVVEEHERALREELGAMALSAADAGLEPRHAALAAQLTDSAADPRTWMELVSDVASAWQATLERHGELLAAAGRARDELARRRDEEAAAAERRRAAVEALSAAAELVERARVDASEALRRWSGALRELAVDRAALDAAEALLLEGRVAVVALQGAADARRHPLHEERATAAARAAALAGEAEALGERIDGLRAERDEPPEPPAWRRADRAGRPGAPLWLAVDFRPEVGPDARAGIEAALEASGLLDAWVTPDGRALVAGTEDAAIVARAEPLAGPTLADVLEPADGDRAVPAADDPAVPASVLRAVLRSVALGLPAPDADAAVSADGSVALGLPSPDTDAAVTADGRFRLGRLEGAASKLVAERIGAAARAERRRRLIAELEHERERLRADERRLREAVAALDGRLERLADELQELPDPSPVADALRAYAAREEAERAAVAEHEQAGAAVRAAAERRVAAESDVREHAAAQGIPPRADGDALTALRVACAEWAARAPGLRQARVALDRARENGARLTGQVGEARQTAELGRRSAREQRAEATRLAAEHRERVAALGASGAELRERHAALVHQLRDARSELERQRDRERELAVEAVRARSELERREREHAVASRERETAHTAFCALDRADAFRLALGEEAPADADRAAVWSMSRALEVARALPDELLTVRSAPGQLAQQVTQRTHLLDRELAEADMAVHAIPEPDGLLVVRVSEGAGESRLAELLDSLDEEIAERERVLSAEQRRVFGDALLEEIAEHLRTRMHDVRGRVERMNAVLARCPTRGGRTVQLKWRAAADDSERLRRAVALLRRPMAVLGEEERGALVDFFRERIELAREERADEPSHVRLAAAFDYRSWHAFDLLEREPDGRPVRLTAKRHATGSGGEQAVLIHLPLFAAAAALYDVSDGARAPRLVMLDEALSGIDDETRERVLAATVALDLDLVMTSHELWATYASVPALSIYQLHRENGVFGVATVRFVWDGAVLRELEQAELPA
jgi:hypothetical protein